MKTVLSEMVYEMGIEENRAILFYYAGHGETEILADKTKMGYIIPKDCPILEKNPMGFATHAISMRDIESASMRIKSKHVLMLFDSCFSGSLFALVRAVPDDITEKSALPVRQYITAGREDEQVPDKSMFKRCFLLGLEGDADLTGDGYITGSELGMYLSDKVVNYTHRRQHPQYGKINNPDLDRGDFIFALKAPPGEKVTVAVAPPQPPKVVEKPEEEIGFNQEISASILTRLGEWNRHYASGYDESGDTEKFWLKFKYTYFFQPLDDEEIPVDLREYLVHPSKLFATASYGTYDRKETGYPDYKEKWKYYGVGGRVYLPSNTGFGGGIFFEDLEWEQGSSEGDYDEKTMSFV
jgi:hypothetical protein